MKVIYIGDAPVITHHGVTFENGKPTNVDDDHPHVEAFKSNPTFQVDGEKPPVREDVDHTPTARDEIMARLTARGVKFDGRAGLAKLQETEADADAKAEVAAQKAVQG